MSTSEKTRTWMLTGRIITASLLLVMQACFPHQYKPDPIDTNLLLNTIRSWSIDNPDLNQFLHLNGIAQEELNSNLFSLERLYLTGLFYDPYIQIAYKKWLKAKLVLENSDFRINPELSIPFEHHSDTSDGQSQWTIGTVLSFIYEREGKRQARQAGFEIDLLNARLMMEKLFSDKHSEIHVLYESYIFSYTRLVELKQEIEALTGLLSQLENKYELGTVSQFEISTTRLELQQRLFELNLQGNLLQGHKDALLSMTHIDFNEFDRINIKYIHPMELIRELQEESPLLESDINSIQSTVLDTHYLLALKFNEYARTEATLKLEIEKQYPDIVLSPGFIFDQSDNIWALGVSWILPIFTNTRQNMEILKALEERKIKQKEILALQRALLRRLYESHRSAKRYAETILSSDEIVKNVEAQGRILEEQIEMGGIDNLSLSRNKIKYYKARQSQIDIYRDASHALHEFQSLIHGYNPHFNIQEILKSWVEINKVSQKQ